MSGLAPLGIAESSTRIHKLKEHYPRRLTPGVPSEVKRLHSISTQPSFQQLESLRLPSLSMNDWRLFCVQSRSFSSDWYLNATVNAFLYSFEFSHIFFLLQAMDNTTELF